jgi:hypothetical protein
MDRQLITQAGKAGDAQNGKGPGDVRGGVEHEVDRPGAEGGRLFIGFDQGAGIEKVNFKEVGMLFELVHKTHDNGERIFVGGSQVGYPSEGGRGSLGGPPHAGSAQQSCTGAYSRRLEKLTSGESFHG